MLEPAAVCSRQCISEVPATRPILNPCDCLKPQTSAIALKAARPLFSTLPLRNARHSNNTRMGKVRRGFFVSTRATSGGQVSGDGTDDSKTTEQLSAEFAEFVNRTQQLQPLDGRKPTALMPPTTVVRVQMDALMRNDWPDDDSGIRTAFTFAMPQRVNELLAGQARPPVSAVRAWHATERYLSQSEFGQVLREPMYRPIINCTHWEVASPMTFHGPGDRRAVQAVRVTAPVTDGEEKSYVFTFCLEKVLTGAYKGCWMVVGMRVGDYANV